MLERVLVVQKPKQAIPDSGPPNTEPNDAAIERRIDAIDPRRHRIASVKIKRAAVNLVATSSGDDVDRARGRNAVCRIESRLGNLKFLDRFLGQVRRRGGYRVVGHIHTVDLNPRGASRPALERNSS